MSIWFVFVAIAIAIQSDGKSFPCVISLSCAFFVIFNILSNALKYSIKLEYYWNTRHTIIWCEEWQIKERMRALLSSIVVCVFMLFHEFDTIKMKFSEAIAYLMFIHSALFPWYQFCLFCFVFLFLAFPRQTEFRYFFFSSRITFLAFPKCNSNMHKSFIYFVWKSILWHCVRYDLFAFWKTTTSPVKWITFLSLSLFLFAQKSLLTYISLLANDKQPPRNCHSKTRMMCSYTQRV